MDLGNAAFDISLCPGARPGVLRREFAEGKPVGVAEFRSVDDAAAALQGRPGEPEPAESVLRLAAQVLLDVAVDEDHAATAIQRLDRRGDARDPGAGDHDVGGMASGAHDGVYSARNVIFGEGT